MGELAAGAALHFASFFLKVRGIQYGYYPRQMRCPQSPREALDLLSYLVDMGFF